MTVIAPIPTEPSTLSSAVTPEQMSQFDEGPLHELIDGQLVEKPMSDYAQLIGNLLNKRLILWAEANDAGLTFVEATFRCFPHDPNMVRRPDVAFISSRRLENYRWEHGHIAIAPDLAAEIVSPGDEVYSLDQKIDDYFQAGVKRIWILNPDRRSVRIHRAPGDIDELVGGETELTDEQLLPGFHVTLLTLFGGIALPR